MPTELPDTTKENYEAKLAEIENGVGKVVRIRMGDGATAKHPLEDIPDHLKERTIVIVDEG